MTLDRKSLSGGLDRKFTEFHGTHLMSNLKKKKIVRKCFFSCGFCRTVTEATG